MGWYRHYVDKHGLFEQEYCRAHPDLAPREILDDDELPSGPVDIVSSSQTSPEENWDDLPELDVLSSSEFNMDELLESDNTDSVDMPDLDPLSDDSESDEEGKDPFAQP